MTVNAPVLAFALVLAGAFGSTAHAAGSFDGLAPTRPTDSGPTWQSLAADGDIAAARVAWPGFGSDPDLVSAPHPAAPAADRARSSRASAAGPARRSLSLTDFAGATAPSPATMLVGGLLVAAWLWRQLAHRPPARTKRHSPIP